VAKKDPTDRTSQVQMHLKQMHQSRKLTKAPSCEWMLEAKLCRCVKEKPGAASDLVPDPIACGLQPLVYLDVRPSPIHALADWVGHPRHRVWRPWRVRLDTTLDPGTNERRHEYAVEMMDGTFAHLPVRASASALAKAMAQELYGFESFNARTVLERYGAQALWDRSARSTTQRPTLLLTRMARRWAADGKEAAERGTHLHALLEARLTGATPATPATKDEAATIDNIVATLDALGYTDLRSEVAMALPTADGGVFCGTADLLAVNEDNNVAVLDLKVTAKDLKIATQDRHGEKRLTYELACSLYALLAESPAAPLVLMVVNPDQSPPTIEFIEIDNKVDVVAGLLADHWPRLLERITADHSAETANAAWMAPHDAEDHAEERLAQLWADQKRGYLSEATMRQAMRSMACARTRADVDRVYNAHHPSA
jgi:RecB family exonuclease